MDVRIARLEEQLTAANARATASDTLVGLLQEQLRTRPTAAEMRLLQERATTAETLVGRLQERLEAARAAVIWEKNEKEQSNAREAAANAREAATRDEKTRIWDERNRIWNDARYFIQFAREQTNKLNEMHERLNSSHYRSIEDPRGPSKRPVVTLLDASRSDYVRRKHSLPSTEYPRVFKIVEGQERLHVRREIQMLREENCEVLAGPVYFANGITLRDSVNKRLIEWAHEQLDGARVAEEVVRYVRWGVFAFRANDRANDRALRNRALISFFLEGVVETVQTTPDGDLHPFNSVEFGQRASVYDD
ncbi:hypothetical protein PHYBOEH_010728 [Phytophthora boehmeriae]|uniref:Uncharacterized protein n=1 Tax=Phytophthora boehmeriae TaxID=109152 RepID=A0A8T1VR38_9STRA|nr:hypothetical protein PHYBOEH_010728 [Phytophthora boehmeriae]